MAAYLPVYMPDHMNAGQPPAQLHMNVYGNGLPANAHMNGGMLFQQHGNMRMPPTGPCQSPCHGGCLQPGAPVAIQHQVPVAMPAHAPACRDHDGAPRPKRPKIADARFDVDLFDQACAAVDNLSEKEKSRLLVYLMGDKHVHTAPPAEPDPDACLLQLLTLWIDLPSMDSNDTPTIAEALCDSLLKIFPKRELLGNLCADMVENACKHNAFKPEHAQRIIALPLMQLEMHKPPPDLVPDDIKRMPVQHPDTINKWKALNREMIKRIVQLQPTANQRWWLRDGIKPLPATSNERDIYFDILRHVRTSFTQPEMRAFTAWLKRDLPPQFRKNVEPAMPAVQHHLAPAAAQPAHVAAHPAAALVAHGQAAVAPAAAQPALMAAHPAAAPVVHGQAAAAPAVQHEMPPGGFHAVPPAGEAPAIHAAPVIAAPAPDPAAALAVHAPPRVQLPNANPAGFDISKYSFDDFKNDASTLRPLSNGVLQSVRDISKHVSFDSHPNLAPSISAFDTALEKFGICKTMREDVYSDYKSATLRLGLRCNKSQAEDIRRWIARALALKHCAAQ